MAAVHDSSMAGRQTRQVSRMGDSQYTITEFDASGVRKFVEPNRCEMIRI